MNLSPEDAKATESDLRQVEQDLQRRGYQTERYRAPRRDGCWACGDNSLGPWRGNIVSSIHDATRTAIIFLAVLCDRCQGDYGKTYAMADRVIEHYIEVIARQKGEGQN